MKEKNIINNSTWAFNLDQINSYAFWEDFLSKDECKEIIKIAKNKKSIEGKTRGNVKNIRKSNIVWLTPNEELDWLFRKITDVVINLNERFFKFDLYGMTEGLQFTNYKAPSGKYDKHIDRSLNYGIRKLSISIQLTDPKEYEGGELKLHEGSIPSIMSKKQGTLIMFPSFTLHEVTPVTKGERNSLVTWVTGKNFK
jgi:PKHD-type hydroxylase